MEKQCVSSSLTFESILWSHKPGAGRPAPFDLSVWVLCHLDSLQDSLDDPRNPRGHYEFVQIEGVKYDIRATPFVTKLSPVPAHNGHGVGWGLSLRCFAREEYDSCGKKQMSNTLKLSPKKAATDAQATPAVSSDTLNVLQVMMQIRQAKTRTEVTLETEKEKDAAEKAVEELVIETTGATKESTHVGSLQIRGLGV